MPSTPKILYLDFDGVLHPDAVYLVKGQPVLKRDGLSLFEWAPLLESVLGEFPDVSIVLSTSWVRAKGFSYARDWLTPALAARVIGATWHSQMSNDFEDNQRFDFGTRHQQIRLDAHRRGLKRWVAIDDDTRAWPEKDLPWLVVCDSDLGLAEPGKLDDLRAKLSALAPSD
jgi:hypothetical protein